MKQGAPYMKNKTNLRPSLLVFGLCLLACLILAPASYAVTDNGDSTSSDSTAPKIQIGSLASDADAINYGLLTAGNSYTQTLTLTNTGDTNVSLSLSLIASDIATLPAERSQILEWLFFVDTPDQTEIAPQNSVTVKLRAKIPDNALGGGQYAALLITADTDNQITLPISAIITGENLSYQSEVTARHLAPWYLQSPVTASTTITNQGNVDFESLAEFTVKNPFTGETIFSDTTSAAILPGASQTIEQSWNEAPVLGVFNITQSVSYYDTAGQAYLSQFSRLVIVCPLWLIILIALLLCVIIVAIILLVRHHHHAKPKNQNSKTSSSTPETPPTQTTTQVDSPNSSASAQTEASPLGATPSESSSSSDQPHSINIERK